MNHLSVAQHRLYLFFCTTFCVVVVVSNLIFQKFVTLSEVWHMQLSVGAMYYPLTFMLTDWTTEFYGQSLAKRMVWLGVAGNLTAIILMVMAIALPATTWSPITDDDFVKLFQAHHVAVMASMIAYGCAQRSDIFIYQGVKTVIPHGHLWLRSALSTLIAQAVDTVVVIGLLSWVGLIPKKHILTVVSTSYGFKVLVTFLALPLYYLGYYMIKRYVFKQDRLDIDISSSDSQLNPVSSHKG